MTDDEIAENAIREVVKGLARTRLLRDRPALLQHVDRLIERYAPSPSSTLGGEQT